MHGFEDLGFEFVEGKVVYCGAKKDEVDSFGVFELEGDVDCERTSFEDSMIDFHALVGDVRPCIEGVMNPLPISHTPFSKAITLRLGTSYEGLNERVNEERKGEEESVNEDNRGEKEKVDEIEGGSEKKKLDNEKTTSIPSEVRNLDGPVPFPNRLAKRKLNDKFAKFLCVMKNLHINLPFIDVVIQMPSYFKFLKDILTNKRNLNDELITLPHQVSAPAQHKMPKKEKRPGNFTLPVKIGYMEARGALADLRASVSLIPLSIAQKLNIEMMPTRKTIQLADRLVKLPCGELEDVPIQVGHIYVPCDFVVMDMDEDVNTPLILGREALKSLGEVINFKNNTITCEVADEKIVFEFSKLLKTPMVEKCYRVDVVSEELDRLGRVMMNPQDPMVEALTCKEEFHSQEAKEFVREMEESSKEEVEQQVEIELESNEEKLEESSKPPLKVELMPLPPSLKYAYLDKEGKYPIIVMLP
ncbi:uncharacterized protein LOC110733172 [Chenopodium quinoa]|uniref:uncharacterized protein LOC110733172 n=1 Tax=Chenopodium quinoa TaxID=63459 RepID=UPI000B77F9BA|nr:uncharacterized protein LOC110733172 [Chenopodium quinoa]